MPTLRLTAMGTESPYTFGGHVRAAHQPRAKWCLGVSVAAALMVLGVAAPAPGQAGAFSLFRIILRDGTAVASYGEYARVGDRVVFSMPIGEVGQNPTLQLVDLPASAVDWESTERYAESTRFAHYVATRAEADFAAFTGQIAELLKQLALVKDPDRRIEIAETARRKLADWPRTHYGYRSKDIRDIGALLDEAVSQLRAEAGARYFDLSLVAAIEPPSVPLLPDPTPAQTIEQTLAVAQASDVPAERRSMLQSVLSYIDGWTAARSTPWAQYARSRAVASLNTEVEAERAYSSLTRRSLADASRLAARADVAGLEAIGDRVRRDDERLGRKRPNEVKALLDAIETHLDAARRLRLARDRWVLRAGLYRKYGHEVGSIIDQLNRMRPALEQIRALAGPDAGALSRATRRASQAADRIKGIVPPTDLAGVHTLLESAASLASQAARARTEAVASGDIQRAWDASSAAAGSMMLLAEARAELERALKPPELS
jgi:hypothetical protein